MVRGSMSVALYLVRGQALINIEKQPTLLVHLVGVSKPDGQIADERAQHQVGSQACAAWWWNQ